MLDGWQESVGVQDEIRFAHELGKPVRYVAPELAPISPTSAHVATGCPEVDQINPTSLMVADAARLLTRAGGQSVTVQMLETELAAGAPTNADGTINLVHYAAWLVRAMANHD
jgi:hypothetical protein